MTNELSWRRVDLAIDFGTANLRLIRRDEGIVFDEPSLCCFTRRDTVSTLVAAGSAARAMSDRTPRSLEVRRPLQRGVLQDIGAATQLLRYALPSAFGRKRMRKPHAVIGVPADATQAERAALRTAASDAGIGSIRLVSEPFAAAIGAGLPVDEPHGAMIVECGAGTTEVAVLSLGGICITRSVRVGGASLDQAIADHLHFRHKFLIGCSTAERIKRDHAAARRGAASGEEELEVRGRSLAKGLPGSFRIALSELDEVVERHVARIVNVVRDVLHVTPPELSRDLHTHGITLTGGSAFLPRLSARIREDTGLEAVVAADPAFCVAQGLHRILADGASA